MRTVLSIISISLFSVILIFCLGCFNSYFYPVKYKDQILDCAQATEISPALVASIINVESGYNKDAQSDKGAVGLMQIMPETAEWVCSKKGLSDIDLKNEDDNILVGCHYLKILLSSFSNQDVAICAYNAGPSRVRSWLVNKDYSSDGETLKTIPFKETSEYLVKIKKNLRHYQKKYN